jgi:hypothetical protein
VKTTGGGLCIGCGNDGPSLRLNAKGEGEVVRMVVVRMVVVAGLGEMMVGASGSCG